MTSGVNQAAIGGDVLGVAAVATFQGSGHSGRVARTPRRFRIREQIRSWREGRHAARATAMAAHDEHVESHWQKMASDYDESWRWRANGF